ncbi:hypothetical protein EK904_008184, partial [Melospiza melodia maxima]
MTGSYDVGAFSSGGDLVWYQGLFQNPVYSQLWDPRQVTVPDSCFCAADQQFWETWTNTPW